MKLLEVKYVNINFSNSEKLFPGESIFRFKPFH